VQCSSSAYVIVDRFEDPLWCSSTAARCTLICPPDFATDLAVWPALSTSALPLLLCFLISIEGAFDFDASDGFCVALVAISPALIGVALPLAPCLLGWSSDSFFGASTGFCRPAALLPERSPPGGFAVGNGTSPPAVAMSATARPYIQFSIGQLYISYAGRGGVDSYTYRIDDLPTSKMQLPSRRSADQCDEFASFHCIRPSPRSLP
jgi:hypothetical protein